LTHCATWGARHDTSQLRPLLEVLHELWELSVEFVIDVLPVFVELLVIVELLVTDELLVTAELFVIVEELFESIELETPAEPLLASTVFPLPSDM
jgi:hypothetical protein